MSTNGKIGVEEFVPKAIRALRTEGRKGIHTVFSGFNAAYRQYYGEGSDPVAATKSLADRGVIVMNPTKGGATIYLPEDQPRKKSAAVVLAKILG